MRTETGISNRTTAGGSIVGERLLVSANAASAAAISANAVVASIHPRGVGVATGARAVSTPVARSQSPRSRRRRFGSRSRHRFSSLTSPGGVSGGNFTEWSRRNDVFVGLAALWWDSFNVTEGETPERVRGVRVAGAYFEVMGVSAALGRGFGEAEQQPGRDDVVVLSHRLWTRLFGSDPRIVGREVRLSGRPRTVLGVMPVQHHLKPDTAALGNWLRSHKERRVGKLRFRKQDATGSTATLWWVEEG